MTVRYRFIQANKLEEVEEVGLGLYKRPNYAGWPAGVWEVAVRE